MFQQQKSHAKVTMVFERTLSHLLCENFHVIDTKITEVISAPTAHRDRVTTIFVHMLSCLCCTEYHDIYPLTEERLLLDQLAYQETMLPNQQMGVISFLKKNPEFSHMFFCSSRLHKKSQLQKLCLSGQEINLVSWSLG